MTEEETIDDYELGEFLGSGAFGDVYEVENEKKGITACLKEMDKEKMKAQKALKYVQGEISVLKELDHPNIIKLYNNFEDDEKYSLIFELCNGSDLKKCLGDKKQKDGKPFSEEVVQYIMRQVIDAVKYLHGKRILHRDLKLENIMVNYDTEEDKKNQNLLKAKMKLIDFGFARHLKPGDWATSNVGSLPYKDPGLIDKCLNNKKIRNSTAFAYDEKIDIWSLGILCYELLVGNWTFDANSQQELEEKVKKGEFSLPDNLSKETISFIIDMLKFDYEKRPSAEKLSTLPFLTKDVKDFTKIDKKASKKIADGKVNLSTKGISQSLFAVFGDDTFDESEKEVKEANKPKPLETITEEEETTTMSKEEISKLFKEDFDIMIDSFISTEPVLIPVIPGTEEKLFNDL